MLRVIAEDDDIKDMCVFLGVAPTLNYPPHDVYTYGIPLNPKPISEHRVTYNTSDKVLNFLLTLLNAAADDGYTHFNTCTKINDDGNDDNYFALVVTKNVRDNYSWKTLATFSPVHNANGTVMNIDGNTYKMTAGENAAHHDFEYDDAADEFDEDE